MIFRVGDLDRPRFTSSDRIAWWLKQASALREAGDEAGARAAEDVAKWWATRLEGGTVYMHGSTRLRQR